MQILLDSYERKKVAHPVVVRYLLLLLLVFSHSHAHAVMWPSAVVLSQWLVTNPSVVRGKRVLEIGAGCGLTGLVAARLQRQYNNERDSDLLKDGQEGEQQHQELILSDFNTTVLLNLQRNVALNNVCEVASVVGLDFYQQSGTGNRWKDMNGVEHEQVDVILAADMICQPADAVGAANTIHDALRPGGRAIVVCADAAHRYGVDHFPAECRRVGLEIMARDVGEMYEGKLLSSGLEQTAGYVEGMSLTLFFLEKSLQ
jgi:predicted nicotinamide N-methyase